MENLHVNVIDDRLGLRYPSLGVVFIQTFSLHHLREFIHDRSAMGEKGDRYDHVKEVFVAKAEHLGQGRAYLDRNIENQIFVLPRDVKGVPLFVEGL